MTKKFTQLTLLFIICSAISFAQCMMVPAPLADRVNGSTQIFEGKVLQKTSSWNEDKTHIYTSNVIEVYKVFKGTITSSTVELLTVGGIVEDEMEVVNPGLQLQKGDVGIFFAEAAANLSSAYNRFEPVDGPQGFVKYDLAQKKATDVFNSYANIDRDVYAAITNFTAKPYTIVNTFDINASARLASTSVGPSVSGFTPASITAGTQSQITINGSGFGTQTGMATIEFRNSSDGGVSWFAADSIVSWTNTQIVAFVPTTAGTGVIRVTDNSGLNDTSATALYITYAQRTAGFERAKLANNNGNGGLTFQFSTAFDANAPAKAAFKRALSTWRCASLVNYDISNVVTNTRCPTIHDGINGIYFDSTTCAIPGSAGGLTDTYFQGCNNGSGFFWTLQEVDIRFATHPPAGRTWNYGPGITDVTHFDFESVALHELGHAQLEDHVNNLHAVMYWQLSYGTDIRTPDGNAIDNANDVMTRSQVGSTCGPGAMTIIASSSCSLTAGIEEISFSSLPFVAYPNPVVKELRLSSPLAKEQLTLRAIHIYNLLGDNLLSLENMQAGEAIIDVSKLDAGMYFITLDNGKQTRSGKFIKE